MSQPIPATAHPLAVYRVLQSLQDNGLTLPSFFHAVLEAKELNQTFFSLATGWSNDVVCAVLDALATGPGTSSATSTWVRLHSRKALRKEMRNIVFKGAGMHFSPSNIRAQDILEFSLENITAKLQNLAPQLWDLITDLLDVDRDTRRRSFGHPGRSAGDETPARYTTYAADDEGNDSDDELYDVWDIEDELLEALGVVFTAPDSKKQSPLANARLQRRRERAARKASSLLQAKATVIISVMMNSSNSRCMLLQSILSFFFHAARVPEVVVELLSHLGLGVSPTTINAMVDSLSEESRERILSLAETLLYAMAYDNFNINFKTLEPTVTHSSSFISATSAAFLALLHGVVRDDLKVSQLLRAVSPYNDNRAPGSAAPYMISYDDLVGLLPQGSGLDGSILSGLAWHIRRILVEQCPEFSSYRSNLATDTLPVPGISIPVQKTTQIPARAMNIDESTNDGNAQVLENLLRQAGFSDTAPELEEYCTLVHGDLGTLERIEALFSSRTIEQLGKLRLQYVIPVPGFFHILMACADAIFRVYLEPKNARAGDMCFYHLACKLRPKETSKLTSDPSFRMLDDVIHNVAYASILARWQEVVRERNPAHTSLALFAKSAPSWDTIVTLSEAIATRYIAWDAFGDQRFESLDKRDQEFENRQLELRDLMLYLDLRYSGRHGHVGRIEENLAHWIPIFVSSHKHKYSVFMARFLTNLKHVWPERFARAIRLNWLCNPSGTADGFRGVDWLLEINNLMHKRIHSGQGPTRTMKYLIKQSPLIELFRASFAVIENNFHMTHRTVRHSRPDMRKTIELLTEYIVRMEIPKFIAGRGAAHVVADCLFDGWDSLQRGNLVVNMNPEEVLESMGAVPVDLDQPGDDDDAELEAASDAFFADIDIDDVAF